MRDLWRGRLSYRRLDALLRQLPEESRTQTALRDLPRPEPKPGEPRKFGPWGLTDYLLAQLIDAVNRNTYTTAVAGQLTPNDPPAPFPRPGLPARQEQGEARNPEAVVLYLEKLRAARGG